MRGICPHRFPLGVLRGPRQLETVMHPGFYSWWKSREHAGCGEGPMPTDPVRTADPDSDDHHHHGGRWGDGPFAHAGHGFEPDAASAFGVRRPLRFLRAQAELEREPGRRCSRPSWMSSKTERAQAAVDQRRRTSALPRPSKAPPSTRPKQQSAGDEQLKSAERARSAVERALKRIHGVLDDEQRKTLAYLLRTGVLEHLTRQEERQWRRRARCIVLRRAALGRELAGCLLAERSAWQNA